VIVRAESDVRLRRQVTATVRLCAYLSLLRYVTLRYGDSALLPFPLLQLCNMMVELGQVSIRRPVAVTMACGE